MDSLINYLKSLLSSETTRVAAYGGGALLAGAVFVAGKLGLTLSPEVTAGVYAIGVFVVTEAIRHFVYAPATVALIAQASVPAENPTQTLSADEPPAAQ